MRKIYLLLLSLILLPYMAVAQNNTGVFNVTGGTLNQDYTYTAPSEYDPNGGDVLTIKSSTPLTISTNSESETTGGCRIVIENNVTANITLAGVNITPADAGTNDGYSGIDLASGATLNITLQSGSSNVINGGTSQSGSPGPGIHVPEGSTLTIGGEGSLQVQGASRGGLAAVGIGGKVSASDAGGACGNVIILGGTITVQGGTPTSGGENAAVDIGGGAAGNGNGGDCNTVIILTSVNSGGSLEIGGGAGAGVGGGKGSDGQGIRPSGDNTYTVWGNLTLPCDITIPEGATVVIPEGASLTVPQGTTLTNNGTIQVNGGTLTGTPEGSGKVQQQLTESIVEIEPTSYTYTGEEIKPVVTIEGYTESEDYEVSYKNNTDAGTATITVKPTDDGSLFGEEVTKTFTISQATNEWTTEPSIQGWTYNETANTPTGASKFGTVSFTYASKDSETYSETAPTAAGDYVLKATVAATDNYTGLEATVEFTIAPITATLGYAETEIKKQVGDEAFINELTNESSIQVSYESSNTEVATVDASSVDASSGEVTILAAGTTTITATDNDPNYEAEAASYTLVVDPITLEEGSGISITGGQQEVEFDGTGTTMTLTATVTVSDGLGTDGQWIWASSNTDIATVPEHGDEAVAMLRANNATESSSATVTIKGTGEAIITATYTDSKYTGEVTFNLKVTEKEEEPAPDPKPDPDPAPTPDPTPLYYNIQFEDICEGVDASLSKGVVKAGNQVSVYREHEGNVQAQPLWLLGRSRGRCTTW